MFNGHTFACIWIRILYVNDMIKAEYDPSELSQGTEWQIINMMKKLELVMIDTKSYQRE
jgi:hypothetical protein